MISGDVPVISATTAIGTPWDVAKLTPDEIMMMRKYTMLQDAAKKYAEQKRKQIGVQQ